MLAIKTCDISLDILVSVVHIVSAHSIPLINFVWTHTKLINSIRCFNQYIFILQHNFRLMLRQLVYRCKLKFSPKFSYNQNYLTILLIPAEPKFLRLLSVFKFLKVKFSTPMVSTIISIVVGFYFL